jgi:hypothetical protein
MFRLDGSSADADDLESATDARAEWRDLEEAALSDGSAEAPSSSDCEENEPNDVRSFSHSYVLQTALQKNQSDPHFNPAHSKIKQSANILQDPPVSSLVATASNAADDPASHRGPASVPVLAEAVMVATLRSEQHRYEESTSIPSLSDENVTAGRWIG